MKTMNCTTKSLRGYCGLLLTLGALLAVTTAHATVLFT